MFITYRIPNNVTIHASAIINGSKTTCVTIPPGEYLRDTLHAAPSLFPVGQELGDYEGTYYFPFGGQVARFEHDISKFKV